MNQSDESRRAQRIDVDMAAVLRETGTTKYNIRLLDLSVTGFRFKSAYELHPGKRVWLNLPKLEGRLASVMWRTGYTYGCAYDQPLHPAVFDHIVRTYG